MLLLKISSCLMVTFLNCRSITIMRVHVSQRGLSQMGSKLFSSQS